MAPLFEFVDHDMKKNVILLQMLTHNTSVLTFSNILALTCLLLNTVSVLHLKCFLQYSHLWAHPLGFFHSEAQREIKKRL